MSAIVRFVPIAVLVLVLQLELFADLRVFGVMPELLLGLTIAAGWNADADRGALAGFIAGGLYDVYLATPLGLTALSYCIVGFLTGVVAEGAAVDSEASIRRIVSMVGIAMGLCVLAVVGELMTAQQYFGVRFIRTLFFAPLYTALFMAPLHRGAHWALGTRDGYAPGQRRLPVLK